MIDILPKKGVKNPAGEVIKRSIDKMGLDGLDSVLMGKRFIVILKNSSNGLWEQKLREISKNLLTNPLIENFQISYK
ncbi:MAG: phosphoribosylformylglycinamidine synthase subunit PurS [Candidatus Kariarchaeaceae archaeon]